MNPTTRKIDFNLTSRPDVQLSYSYKLIAKQNFSGFTYSMWSLDFCLAVLGVPLAKFQQ